MMTLNFRRRLALVQTAVIVSVLAVAAIAGYLSLSDAVNEQLDGALLALAETESSMLRAAPGQQPKVHDAEQGSAPPSLARLDRWVQIVDAQGKVLARSANLGAANLPATPALMARMAAGDTVFQTLDHFAEEPVRIVSLPVPGKPLRYTVQVAGSLDDVRHVIASASRMFLGMALVLLVALIVASASITRWVFRAIDDIVRQAQRIGEADLDKRLPHPGTRDEIGRLVDTLNDMLGRIDQSFQMQRRFTSDASHELRSPLSRLRAEIEITLRRPRDTTEYVDTLRSCMEEVERLTLLVEELLALARYDAGQDRDGAACTALDDIAAAAIERARATAQKRGVGLSLQAGAEPVFAAIGDGAATLIVVNLLENAIKFTPAGGAVGIDIRRDGDCACLRITDSGPGISVDDLPHLFERFYRGASARSGAVAGVGLGLALTQAIVQGHGGRIEAANLPAGGAAFTVYLPCVAATAPRMP
ncbi:two-component sensor histidine kinase transcription regulator protein [Janthinobacterium sp. HH01]|uniref:ATP-binding protein n=1 Tax=Janthinobacterium sp. HH01 TaxID=1198452 RepID=UPI0002AEBBA7|nr:ATP-binding protein [Janthinobacterium sp. HH01]ELX09436.1 two-component sensor histidine kinase transcription regulator protein [Janthinobacterium sp. HH01]